MMHGIYPLDFQEECSEYLKEYCLNSNNKHKTIIKAPTGSGKTLMLLNFIDKLNQDKNIGLVYVWLTPGNGELEEQSMAKMQKWLPNNTSKDLQIALNSDFEDKDVVFINWEKVTSKKNKALGETERKNLFERIMDAHSKGLRFICIVDEEHSHNTAKANSVIDAFTPLYEIRVSATAGKDSLYDRYEISDAEVIASGLITKAIYINEGLQKKQIGDENGYLLNLANNKRKEILNDYRLLEKVINPLVIVQFPNERPALIKSIEEKLEDLDITYDNGRLAIWMSDRKVNIDDITENDNPVQFLLIKQAVNTGWDCPRAKILVKLRENMNENFEIQTIGRIRRMPEAKHYDLETLDNAYLYTFDDKYKDAVIRGVGYAYELKPIFLKERFKSIKLTKQLRNRDIEILGDREILTNFEKYYTKKYKLTKDPKKNRVLMEAHGYHISDSINANVLHGKVSSIEKIKSDTSVLNIELLVNTHEHAMDLRHNIDSLKGLIGLNYDKTRMVLELLFRDSRDYRNKLLNLSTSEFYAFIINNIESFREDLKEGMKGGYFSQKLALVSPREEDFKLPIEDTFKYIPDKRAKEIENNTYKGYTDECLVDPIRSLPERLFERWCMQNADWYYKNGDTGQQYFSIVYVDGNGKQHLFYADYILSINNKMWIIETKGGESSKGQDKNIDISVINKFNAFKEYSSKYKLNWGFVRDKNEKLYFNNTIYTNSLDSDNWIPLDAIIDGD